MNPAVRVVTILAGDVAIFALATYAAGMLTGWHNLAQRFRFQGGTFQGTKWSFQTGYMRFSSHYGGCLTVGVDSTGLYLAVWPILRLGSPTLLIPWNEVSVLGEKRRFFSRVVEFRLGRQEQIPLRLKATLAEKLRQAAGAAWSVETIAA